LPTLLGVTLAVFQQEDGQGDPQQRRQRVEKPPHHITAQRSAHQRRLLRGVPRSARGSARNDSPPVSPCTCLTSSPGGESLPRRVDRVPLLDGRNGYTDQALYRGHVPVLRPEEDPWSVGPDSLLG